LSQEAIMIDSRWNTRAAGNTTLLKAKSVVGELVAAMPIVILARAARSALQKRPEASTAAPLRPASR
jgi:hypothetical protein